MRINCKVAENYCPLGLTICCGCCDRSIDCKERCNDEYLSDYLNCPEGEFITPPTTFESAVPETIMRIASLMRMKKQLEDQEKELKKQLTKAMEDYGIKSYENDTIKMTYVAPTTRNTIDSTRLKKDHPELVEEYTKVSNVSASVRVTVKGDV